MMGSEPSLGSAHVDLTPAAVRAAMVPCSSLRANANVHAHACVSRPNEEWVSRDRAALDGLGRARAPASTRPRAAIV
jgi:hypothetical protein